MKAALMKCLAGKEPLVRAHSVTALSDLAVNEYPCDLEHNVPLVTTTSHPSTTTSPCTSPSFHLTATNSNSNSYSEVRSAVLPFPFTPTALPALLSRTRDPDTLTHKLVFASTLLRLARPRYLTLAQRETIVQRGPGDCAEAVHVAAQKLLGSWMDACEEEGGAG